MKKKSYLYIIIIYLSLFLNFTLPVNITANVNTEYSPNTKSIRAVSINVLQKQLKVSKSKKIYPEKLLKLVDLKYIRGYIIDEENNDLIIFGQTGQNLPPLYLEDFVIALRNAWFKYAPLKGNTYQYSYAGCSIDPNPQTIQKLQAIGQRVARSSSFEQVEEKLYKWHSTCKEPQNVRVMGVPFNTRFAQIMVKADYDMKLLVDGSDSLNIPGFTSLVDRKLALIRNSIHQNKPITVSLASMDRFWFYPGNNLYEEDIGIVLIKQCPVELLTEAMFLGASGGYTSGSGTTDPLARKFTEGFSVLYDKVAKNRPIYLELENLFRFTALAKIIKFKSTHTKAGTDLNFLLNDFPIKQNPVEKNLSGRSAVKEFQHRQEFQGGYQVLKLWLPSCGGVSINIEAKPQHFIENTNGLLSNLKSKILNARPFRNALKWDVPETSDGLISDIEESYRISDINRLNDNFSTLSVKFDGDDGYKVFNGTNDPIFTSHSETKLFRAIKERMGKDLKRTVYFDLKELPSPDKREAFKSTIRMQANQYDKIKIETIDCSNRLRDNINSPGEIRLQKTTDSITKVTNSKYKNRCTFSFNFLTKVSDEIRQLIIDVFAKTMNLAQAFLQRLTAYTTYSSEPVSLPDKINEIIRDIEKTHKLEKGDIKIRIKDELDDIEIGINLLTTNWRTV